MSEDLQPLSDAPGPKRTMRTVTVAVMAVTALFSAWLAWSLKGDAGYALQSQKPVTVADASQHAGEYVRAAVVTADKPTLGFRRPFEPDPYRATQVSDKLWVIYGVPASIGGPRFVPPRLVAGRAIAVADLGTRYSGVQGAMEELAGKPQGGAVVVIDNEDPEGLTWVLGLEALLILFIGFNLVSIARVLRTIQPADEIDSSASLNEKAADAQSPVR